MKCHKCGESNWECECWLASKTGDLPKAEASSRPLDEIVGLRGSGETGSTLTPRELYLIDSAYTAGYISGVFNTEECLDGNPTEMVKEWLSSAISDAGHTVDMLLSHEATERTKAN